MAHPPCKSRAGNGHPRELRAPGDSAGPAPGGTERAVRDGDQHCLAGRARGWPAGPGKVPPSGAALRVAGGTRVWPCASPRCWQQAQGGPRCGTARAVCSTVLVRRALPSRHCRAGDTDPRAGTPGTVGWPCFGHVLPGLKREPEILNARAKMQVKSKGAHYTLAPARPVNFNWREAYVRWPVLWVCSVL